MRKKRGGTNKNPFPEQYQDQFLAKVGGFQIYLWRLFF